MQWEYVTHKIVYGSTFSDGVFDERSITDILNWYGAQQWELVSTLTTISHGYTSHMGFVFKRPLAPATPPVQAQA